MIRKTLFLIALALSTTTVTACVDEDPKGPQKSEEEDPDFEETDSEDDGPPIGCQQIQDSDDPDCNPKV